MFSFLNRSILLAVLFVSSLLQASLPVRFEAEKGLTEMRNNIVRDLRAQERDALEAYDFVLVDGILGDLTQSLYADVLSYLKSQFPKSDLRVLRPSSFVSLEDNARSLALQLAPSSRVSNRPRIVIAHSRGAAGVFLMLLQNPQLLEASNIARVVLVQGAFSGSPIADWTSEMVEKGCGRDSMSEVWEGVCDFVDLFAPSLQSLRTYESRQSRVTLQRAMHPLDQEKFKNQVFFVRSRVSLAKASLPLKPSALYLGHYYNAFENDGILLTMQQRVPGFGKDLGILEADHLALLGKNGKNSKTSQVFIRSLLAELLR